MTKQTQTTTKVTKAVQTVYVALEEMVQGIQLIGQGENITHDAFEKIRKAKVTIGSLKSKCAVALKFRDILCATVNPKTGQLYPQQTASNYLTAMRKALKDGTPLVLNTHRKAPAEGQASTPASKDKAKLTEESETMADTDIMATDDAKPAAVKPAAFKSNDDAIEAVKAAIKTVKTSCTAKQWQAIATLYPKVAELAE